ncbi:hypothetical protein BO94DRAFT_537805 [Aspergillus sclerotioniger CBS 115572]|uniref:LipA and NB-ARC domain protein n=1 Tax=Aspergillus sclerotioniger CBS 115572 TaxID=1450535 RepID=A0A317VXF5_9EURO|nr:hypothetical protein BO94DRAFT_537805 [Aspergillus sclerotioniger CBS 115572]PWY78021.1 hypothetical protein BO94DRAFT_537805 [Aspergillus sclerotioniger CBS 115572]
MATNHHLNRKPVSQTSPNGTIRGVITISPPTPPPRPSTFKRQQQKRQEPSPQPHPSSQPHNPPPAYTPRLPIRSATTHNDHQRPTKTTTILRHSHGIVFYRSSSTSLTLSIFSTTPLPTTRTLWLQNKGWTGKTGMRTKTFLGLTDSWINVTPTIPIRAEQIDPEDERAWQRDIAKFRKSAQGGIREHVLRETVVVRIPVEAGDGYFRVVLCGDEQKKKVVCYSPVFRVLSTTWSMSSVRGASLSTLPLEMGALVVGMYVQSTAEAVVAPVTEAVQNKVQPYEPGWVTRTAAETAYSVSGVEDRVDSVLGIGDGDEDEDGDGERTRDVQLGCQVALEDGPAAPFPVDFRARVDVEEGDGVRFRLARVSDIVLDRYHGFFFGWVRVEGVGATAQRGPDSVAGPWQGIVLSMVYWDPTQQTRVSLSQAMKKVTTIRFIDEPAVPFRAQARIQIRIMGFLHPDVPPPRGQTEQDLITAREAAAEAAMLADACDVSYAQSVLKHPAWAADRPRVTETRSRGSNEASSSGSGSWMDRTREGVQNVKYRGQKLAEKIPLNRIGVRAPTDEARDKQVAVNGFYIVRG